MNRLLVGVYYKAIGFPNEGKLTLLKMILDNGVCANIRLFKNDLEVDALSELGKPA